MTDWFLNFSPLRGDFNESILILYEKILLVGCYFGVPQCHAKRFPFYGLCQSVKKIAGEFFAFSRQYTMEINDLERRRRKILAFYKQSKREYYDLGHHRRTFSALGCA